MIHTRGISKSLDRLHALPFGLGIGRGKLRLKEVDDFEMQRQQRQHVDSDDRGA